MYSINIPLSYTLQSLNIILTSLRLCNIYNAVKGNYNIFNAAHMMIGFCVFFIPK